ncbi:hypothetical protein QA601_18590 [Chitinispirillales bacterium ANBcel5]|uniref:hypothetical protein n=1 Tax=Cellulosispirillum alkaliphilum TaxID=3039283 RepID=UPI002A529BDC|nr:hypothetical protein [Chitinispirillales bacterium ANBcel5]
MIDSDIIMKVNIKNESVNVAKFFDNKLFISFVGDDKINIHHQNSELVKSIQFGSPVMDFIIEEQNIYALRKHNSQSHIIITKKTFNGEFIEEFSLHLEDKLNRVKLISNNLILLSTNTSISLTNFIKAQPQITFPLDSLIVLSEIEYNFLENNLICVVSKYNSVFLLTASSIKQELIPINHLLGDTFSIYSKIYFLDNRMYLDNPTIEQSRDGDLTTKIVGSNLFRINIENMTLVEILKSGKQLNILGLGTNNIILSENGNIIVAKFLDSYK